MSNSKVSIYAWVLHMWKQIRPVNKEVAYSSAIDWRDFDINDPKRRAHKNVMSKLAFSILSLNLSLMMLEYVGHHDDQHISHESNNFLKYTTSSILSWLFSRNLCDSVRLF